MTNKKVAKIEGNEETIKKIYDRFYNDPAGFAVAFTNIFQEPDGTRQELYPKQVEFLNLLKPTDKVTAVVKSRQCLAENTLVECEHGKQTIKWVYEQFSLGKKIKVWTIDENKFPYLDDVVDCWDTGIKDTLKVRFTQNVTIQATPEHKFKCNENGEWKQLKDITEKDLVWVRRQYQVHPHKIYKFVPGIFQCQTYDLTTKKYNSYFADGILTHNSGFSTAIKAKAIHAAYFNKFPYILIASAGQLQATKVLREIKEAILSMPEFMRPELDKNSETEIHFSSGSKLLSLPANPKTVRGFPKAMVMLDEFGVFSRKESSEMWDALLPSITKGGLIVAVSTPGGKDNLFYDLCNPKFDEEGNMTGTRADKIIKVHYLDVPHVRKGVEEMQLWNKMPVQSFRQEYECQFIESSENALFDYNLIHDKLIQVDLELVNLTPVDTFIGEDIPTELRLNHLKKEFTKGIYAGWDPALVGDGSIFVCFGVNSEDIWKMIALKELKSMSMASQVEWVARALIYLQCKKLTFDSTAGIGLAFEERLKETSASSLAKGFKFTSISKAQEYSQLKMKIESNGMKCPDNQELVNQFVGLGYNPVTGRIGSMGSHRTNHDDIPSAILCAYAGRRSNTCETRFVII